jgi:hypothetical protein
MTDAERVYILADERAMDPDQFEDAAIYGVARSLAEARDMRTESGCGVVVKCRLVEDGVVEWEEYIP